MIAAITGTGTAVAVLERMRPDIDKPAPGTFWLYLFGSFVLIGGFFLIAEHRAHLFEALPYLLGLVALVFCIFGHRHAGTWGRHDDEGGAR